MQYPIQNNHMNDFLSTSTNRGAPNPPECEQIIGIKYAL